MTSFKRIVGVDGCSAHCWNFPLFPLKLFPSNWQLGDGLEGASLLYPQGAGFLNKAPISTNIEKEQLNLSLVLTPAGNSIFKHLIWKVIYIYHKEKNIYIAKVTRQKG